MASLMEDDDDSLLEDLDSLKENQKVEIIVEANFLDETNSSIGMKPSDRSACSSTIQEIQKYDKYDKYASLEMEALEEEESGAEEESASSKVCPPDDDKYVSLNTSFSKDSSVHVEEAPNPSRSTTFEHEPASSSVSSEPSVASECSGTLASTVESSLRNNAPVETSWMKQPLKLMTPVTSCTGRTYDFENYEDDESILLAKFSGDSNSITLDDMSLGLTPCGWFQIGVDEAQTYGLAPRPSDKEESAHKGLKYDSVVSFAVSQHAESQDEPDMNPNFQKRIRFGSPSIITYEDSADMTSGSQHKVLGDDNHLSPTNESSSRSEHANDEDQVSIETPITRQEVLASGLAQGRSTKTLQQTPPLDNDDNEEVSTHDQNATSDLDRIISSLGSFFAEPPGVEVEIGFFAASNPPTPTARDNKVTTEYTDEDEEVQSAAWLEGALERVQASIARSNSAGSEDLLSQTEHGLSSFSGDRSQDAMDMLQGDFHDESAPKVESSNAPSSSEAGCRNTKLRQPETSRDQRIIEQQRETGHAAENNEKWIQTGPSSEVTPNDSSCTKRVPKRDELLTDIESSGDNQSESDSVQREGDKDGEGERPIRSVSGPVGIAFKEPTSLQPATEKNMDELIVPNMEGNASAPDTPAGTVDPTVDCEYLGTARKTTTGVDFLEGPSPVAARSLGTPIASQRDLDLVQPVFEMELIDDKIFEDEYAGFRENTGDLDARKRQSGQNFCFTSIGLNRYKRLSPIHEGPSKDETDPLSTSSSGSFRDRHIRVDPKNVCCHGNKEELDNSPLSKCSSGSLSHNEDSENGIFQVITEEVHNSIDPEKMEKVPKCMPSPGSLRDENASVDLENDKGPYETQPAPSAVQTSSASVDREESGALCISTGADNEKHEDNMPSMGHGSDPDGLDSATSSQSGVIRSFRQKTTTAEDAGGTNSSSGSPPRDFHPSRRFGISVGEESVEVVDTAGEDLQEGPRNEALESVEGQTVDTPKRLNKVIARVKKSESSHQSLLEAMGNWDPDAHQSAMVDAFSHAQILVKRKGNGGHALTAIGPFGVSNQPAAAMLLSFSASFGEDGSHLLGEPVTLADRIPFVHSNFGSAAPLMLSDLKFTRLLRCLMPAIHAEVADKVGDLTPETVTKEKLRYVQKRFESNPVTAAYGVVTAEKNPVIHGMERIDTREGESSDTRPRRADKPLSRIPVLEWNIILDHSLVRQLESEMSKSSQGTVSPKKSSVHDKIAARARVEVELNHVLRNVYIGRNSDPCDSSGMLLERWLALFAGALRLASDSCNLQDISGLTEMQEASFVENPMSKEHRDSLRAQNVHSDYDDESWMSARADQINAILGAPLRIILRPKTPMVSPAAWALLVDKIISQGIEIEGVAASGKDARLISSLCLYSVKCIRIFDSASELQEACLAQDIQSGDTVFFNAASLLMREPSLLSFALCHPDYTLSQRPFFQPYAYPLSTMPDCFKSNHRMFTLQDYQRAFDLRIGVYVDEYSFAPETLYVLVHFINHNKSIFNLGLAYGGINGLTVRGLEDEYQSKNWSVGRLQWDLWANPLPAKTGFWKSLLEFKNPLSSVSIFR